MPAGCHQHQACAREDEEIFPSRILEGTDASDWTTVADAAAPRVTSKTAMFGANSASAVDQSPLGARLRFPQDDFRRM